MTNARPQHHARLVLACTLGAALALGALGGCRGERSDKPPRQFFPDMDDGPTWKPQSESEFFPDARTMRQPPDGSVPFGTADFDPGADGVDAWASPWLAERAGLLAEDDAVYRGVDAEGNYVETIPPAIEVDRALIERGRERFDIYCAVCHGIYGDGQGLVGQRWSIPVANFHDAKYKDRSVQTGKDGYIFHTALNGKGEGDSQTMPGYAHAIDEREAWAIVAYIRTLQAARSGGGS